MNKLSIKPFFVFFLSAIFFIVFFSCNDEIVFPSGQIIFNQIPGCQRQHLNKSSLIDSCFSYLFNENLVVDFCVTGNCCPDKDRYIITSSIVEDSIFITVKDTAKNLCRCICNYIIHGEFQSLTKNNYIIKCIQKGLPDKEVIYLKQVSRYKLLNQIGKNQI